MRSFSDKGSLMLEGAGHAANAGLTRYRTSFQDLPDAIARLKQAFARA